MILIKATCPSCGDVDLTAMDVRLEVAETLTEPIRTFHFVCVHCYEPVRGETTAEIAESLERAGVSTRHLRLPAEMREQHWGPPITEDDVIAFGAWLHTVSDPLSALRAV